MRALTSDPTDPVSGAGPGPVRAREAPKAPGPPSLSVLVTAWRRKQFLPEALRSLEQQTLSRDAFEIVVVKDFEDPAIDQQLARLGARELRFGSDNLGRTMSLGVGACRGEVICFLDDDDQFDPRKLSVVHTEFHRHPDLGYFHNGLDLIDEAGHAMVGKDPVARTRALAMSKDWDFCMSCISVRRELVRPLLERWPEVPKAPDSFLDYVSRASAHARRGTLAPLTRYRVHPRSNSRRTNHAPALLSTARILRAFPRSRVRNAAVSSLLGRYMSEALRGRSRDRRDALWALAYLLTSATPSEFRPDAREVLFGALIPLSPSVAQRLYGLSRKGEVDWLLGGAASDPSTPGPAADPTPPAPSPKNPPAALAPAGPPSARRSTPAGGEESGGPAVPTSGHG